MKNICRLILVALLSHTGFAQSRQHQQKKPDTYLLCMSTLENKNKPGIDTTLYQYDNKCRVVIMIYKVHISIIQGLLRSFTKTLNYDEKGRLKKVIINFGFSRRNEINYIYYKDSLTEDIVQFKSDSITNTFKYSYITDTKGRIIKRNVLYNKELTRPHRFYNTFKYDANGNMILKTDHMANSQEDQLTDSTHYYYNDKKNAMVSIATMFDPQANINHNQNIGFTNRDLLFTNDEAPQKHELNLVTAEYNAAGYPVTEVFEFKQDLGAAETITKRYTYITAGRHN